MEILGADFEAQVAAHAELRQTSEWKHVQRRISLNTRGFLLGLHTSWLMSRRWTDYYDNTLTYRFIDDLMESAISIHVEVDNGALNSARRELRFVLETAINHAYIDRLLPRADLETKLGHPEARDVDIVKAARKMGMIVALGPLYGRLSQVVHPTPAQLRTRLEQSARGVYLGFETPAELREFAELQLEVYDIALWCVFDSLGPGLTGDLFINVFDDVLWWPYHHSPLAYSISRGLNYKAERQNSKAGPVRDRMQDFLRVLEARCRELSRQDAGFP